MVINMKDCLDIFQRPDIYKLEVVAEMKKIGANKEEISLLKDETIMNAIKNKRNPSDIAWAIIQ